MKTIFKNKKADSVFVIGAWWFIIFVLVGGVVLIALLIFFGAKVDVRTIEAESLTDKVFSCVVKENVLDEEFLSDMSNEKFQEKCNLNLESRDINVKDIQYYVGIEINGKVEEKEITKEHIFGANMKTECEVSMKQNVPKGPKCQKNDFFIFDKNKNKLNLKILVGIKKIEKNV